MQKKPPTPHLKPTNWGLLLLSSVLTCLISFLLIKKYYGSWESLTFAPSIALALLALLNFWLVWLVKNKLKNNAIGWGPKRISPVLVAKFAIIGKVSALVGGLLTGFWLAFVIYLLRHWELEAVKNDFSYALLAFIFSVLLLIAGIWLELTCRIPPTDEYETAENPAN